MKRKKKGSRAAELIVSCNCRNEIEGKQGGKNEREMILW